MKKIYFLVILFATNNFFSQENLIDGAVQNWKYNNDSTYASRSTNYFLDFVYLVHDFSELNNTLINENLPELSNGKFSVGISNNLMEFKNFKKNTHTKINSNFIYQNIENNSDTATTELNYFLYGLNYSYNLIKNKDFDLFLSGGLGISRYYLSTTSNNSNSNSFISVINGVSNSGRLFKTNGVGSIHLTLKYDDGLFPFGVISFGYNFNILSNDWKVNNNNSMEGPNFGNGNIVMRILSNF
jgi:hypothetical protein